MKSELKELLTKRQIRRIDDPTRIPSAVMVPLFKSNGQYQVVFIKRTITVREHKGQISFPGGTRDKKDKTLLDTALRECDEEIGVHPGDVEILGELDDEITTTSNFIVSPFVGVIPWPYNFTRNKAEVEEIIEVPISHLLDKKCMGPGIETLNGMIVDSYTYYYQDKIIWGATARILYKFLGILTGALTEN